jgi:hypothetical protein
MLWYFNHDGDRQMMKFKTQQLAERLVSVISRWPGVECVSLNEAALPSPLDPYFALILDVYYDGSLPGSDERCLMFGADVAEFETAAAGGIPLQSEAAGGEKPAASRESKDRFLVGELPVRLEYKSVRLADEAVSIAEECRESFRFIKDSGTYGFYRLASSEILFSKSGWITGIRARLAALPEVYWQLMRNAYESRMEHFLADFGAAVRQNDGFFYLTSAAGFIKSACLTLFCVNRRFEPSHRAYYQQVTRLGELPESFKAQLENFLRPDTAGTMERKFSLAQLIARGIVAL